jgi:hypothetical protein
MQPSWRFGIVPVHMESELKAKAGCTNLKEVKGFAGRASLGHEKSKKLKAWNFRKMPVLLWDQRESERGKMRERASNDYSTSLIFNNGKDIKDGLRC